MTRKQFIAGNWKMNKTPQEALKLIEELCASIPLEHRTNVDIAVAPTSVCLLEASRTLKDSGIFLSGQNCHSAASGAFTGELSTEMLKASGCTYVLIGHSERRTIFGETNELIGQKMHAAFRGGLLPILCVGETLEQRNNGTAQSTVQEQIYAGFDGLDADQAAAVTLAYEPVWAIGTGVTASPDQAQDMHHSIRKMLLELYPPFVSKSIRIQYGGSVKPHNALDLLSQPDIDGALVGGAALKSDSFSAIVAAGASLG